jgi:hypothetical protein
MQCNYEDDNNVQLWEMRTPIQFVEEPITSQILHCLVINYFHCTELKSHHTKNFQIKIGLNEMHISGHESSMQHKRIDEV